MSQESNTESSASIDQASHPHRRSPAIIVASVVVIVAIVAFVSWFLWPRQSGKPVPAPRSVSFGESSNPQTATMGDQILILSQSI